MKIPFLLLATLGFPLLTTHAVAQQRVDMEFCRMATANFEICCQAPDWRWIMTPASRERCQRNREETADDVVGSISRPRGGNDNPDQQPPSSEAGLGNPGNHKDVGRAGEKYMANEGVSPSDSAYGTRGFSDLQGKSNK